MTFISFHLKNLRFEDSFFTVGQSKEAKKLAVGIA